MIDEITGDFLQRLRGFYFVAKEGGLRKAAIAMGREKATITRQIQHLEKELGVTLFDRSSGKMVTTPEGRILQEKAVVLFEYVREIKGEFRNEEIHYRGNIAIVTTHAIIDTILLPYIRHFKRLHPQVTFQCEGVSREKICEKVESAEADFGISFFEGDHKTLAFHDLFKAGQILIAPKNNPYFSGKAPPTLKQIAEAPLILFAHNGLKDPLIERRLAKARLNPDIVMAHNSFVSIKRYVANGMGVAILGRVAISLEDEQSFDIYSMDRYFPQWTYGILLKKKKYLSPGVKAFLRTIKPDIDFSASQEPSEAPVLSLRKFLQRRVGVNRPEAPTAEAGKGRAR